MKVMTFNIRNAIADDGENSWKYRKNAVFDYTGKTLYSITFQRAMQR